MTLLTAAQVQVSLLLAPLFQETGAQGAGPAIGIGEGAPATGEGAAAQGGSGLLGFLPFLAIGLIFWFLILGPERKRQKQRAAMLGELEKGNRVLLTSGLFATVAQVHEHVVTLQLADGVRIKAARWAVQQIVESEETAATEPEPVRR